MALLNELLSLTTTACFYLFSECELHLIFFFAACVRSYSSSLSFETSLADSLEVGYLFFCGLWLTGEPSLTRISDVSEPTDALDIFWYSALFYHAYTLASVDFQADLAFVCPWVMADEPVPLSPLSSLSGFLPLLAPIQVFECPEYLVLVYETFRLWGLDLPVSVLPGFNFTRADFEANFSWSVSDELSSVFFGLVWGSISGTKSDVLYCVRSLADEF